MSNTITQVFFSFCFFFVHCFLLAQNHNEKEKENLHNMYFYAEVGGPGNVFSANLDGRFHPSSELGLGYRFGVGFGYAYEDIFTLIPDDKNPNWPSYTYEEISTSFVTIPLVINYLFGKDNSPHIFEVGLGASVLSEKVNLYNYTENLAKGYFIGHAHFMYRRQPLSGGFAWRIGLMPVVGTGGDILLSGAASIGYVF